jgi:hypothetical protein
MNQFRTKMTIPNMKIQVIGLVLLWGLQIG